MRKKTLKKVIKDPSLIGRVLFQKMVVKDKLRWMPDKTFLKIRYRHLIGKKLNLKNPITFNEKLQWLKLYDRNPKYNQLVDKYEVRKYIKATIGEEYLIPLLGVWDRFEDIDFGVLPNRFVLKCVHDSGSVIICNDKRSFDFEHSRQKLNEKIKKNLFWEGREWPYKNLKPRIIAEQYMEDSKTEELRDYKFFCYGGVVKCFKIDFDRFTNHRANYYDRNGDILPFGEVCCPPDFTRKLEMPVNLDLMLRMAEKLSNGIPFLRVDFYEVNGRVYFGELTFFPASGFGAFEPEEWDYKLGEWLELPQKTGE